MADHATRGETPGPLAGVRVLDFTRVLAGPFCTRMLADLGADVIKIEPPDADFTRGMGKRVNGLSGYFTQQNVGKRNICLDLRQPGATDVVLDMVEHVDILAENFRPGVMARFGLDEESLRAHNPRLIHCAISGFGQDSLEEDKRAFAGVMHAMTGIDHHQAHTDGREPTDSVLAVGDTVTGLQALAAILAALYQREQTGRGQAIDIAMHDCLLSVNEHCGQMLFDDPDLWRPHNGKILKGRDGHLLYAGDVVHNFPKVLRATGRQEWAEDPRFATVDARRHHETELFAELERWVAEQPSIADAEAKLDAAGLPSGPVRTLPEALESRQAAHRNMVVEVSDRGAAGGTVRVINSPYKFSDASTGPQGPAAYRGEHNHEVLREVCGYTDAQIDALEDARILIKSMKKKR